MPRTFNFNLPGDGFPGKNNRIASQRKKKTEEVQRRQDARVRDGGHHIPTLLPNVDGQQTESWADASKLAKDKGKDTSTYEPMVQKERAAK